MIRHARWDYAFTPVVVEVCQSSSPHPLATFECGWDVRTSRLARGLTYTLPAWASTTTVYVSYLSTAPIAGKEIMRSRKIVMEPGDDLHLH